MSNPLETAEKAMALIDDSFESREEAEQTRTERQRIDLTSAFKLPHLIRPYMAIWGMITFTLAQAYCLYADLITGLEAMGANTAIVMAIIGWYFNSRKAEKTVAKQMAGQFAIVQLKAKTAVKIEAIKAKVELADTSKRNRIERKKLKKALKAGVQTP
jgi:hypothetical protein